MGRIEDEDALLAASNPTWKTDAAVIDAINAPVYEPDPPPAPTPPVEAAVMDAIQAPVHRDAGIISATDLDAPAPAIPIENVYDTIDATVVTPGAVAPVQRAAPPVEGITTHAALSPVDPSLRPEVAAATDARSKAETDAVRLKANADDDVADFERAQKREALARDAAAAREGERRAREADKLRSSALAIEKEIADQPLEIRRRGSKAGGFFAMFGRALVGAAVGPDGVAKLRDMALREAERDVQDQLAQINKRRTDADRQLTAVDRLLAAGHSLDAAAAKARDIALKQAELDLQEFAQVARAPEKKAQADAVIAGLREDRAKAMADYDKATGDQVTIGFTQAARPGTGVALLNARDEIRHSELAKAAPPKGPPRAPPPLTGQALEDATMAAIRDTPDDAPPDVEGPKGAELEQAMADAIAAPVGGLKAIAKTPSGVTPKQAIKAAQKFLTNPQKEGTAVSDLQADALSTDSPDAIVTKLIATYGGDFKRIGKIKESVQKAYDLKRGGAALALMLGDFRYVEQRYRGRIVTMPNGQRAFAHTDAKATELQIGLDAARDLRNNYSRLVQLAGKPGHSINPQDLEEIRSHAADNVLILKNLKGLGVLTESDIELIAPMTGKSLENTRNIDAATVHALKVALQKLQKCDNAAGMKLTRDPLGRVPWR